MLSISGYTIINELFNDGTFIGLTAKDESGELYLIKTTLSALPSKSLVSRVEYEKDILLALSGGESFRFKEFITVENRPVIISSFRECISLQEFYQKKDMDRETFFDISRKLVKGLISIHKKDIIHKGLSPRTIYITSDNQLVFISFGFSEFHTGMTRSVIDEYSPGDLFPYMSPESLGIFNLPQGFFSDYYSLGAVFYFLIRGVDPFSTFTSDHLTDFLLNADERFSPLESQIWGSALLSIINKLLSPRSMDRYFSLEGLLKDLDKISNDNSLQGFIPGERDIPRRFIVPEYFFGNRDEIAILQRLIDKSFTTADGSYALISGQAGTGKSLLGEELRWSVLKRKGFFIEGRFDPLSRERPYSAILSAFNQLVYQLLSKSYDDQALWRKALFDKMGDSLHVILQLIPQLEKITGPVEPLRELDSIKSKVRFFEAINSFVSVIASIEHPLVLVLDDLQWADDSSLSLILKSLEFEGDLPISIILCYREEGLEGNESLSSFLEQIVNSNVPLVKLALGNLSENTVIHLLKRITGSSEEDLQSLAEICEKKTYGNPLFIRQFLRSLHREGLLFFDETQECWSWDLEAVRKKDIGDNVVEFLSERIQRLPSDVKLFLQYAACLGRVFCIDIISSIMQVPVEESAVYIQEAMLHGLVSSTNGGYIKDIPRCYQFLHNRIQQAVYSGLSDIESRSIHLRIGEYFYQEYANTEDSSLLYEMAGHFNKGADLVENLQEKLKILKINLKAGKLARRTLAVETALGFLQRAISLLPEDSWRLFYDLTYSLYSEAAECSQLALEERQMEYFCTIISQKGRDIPDRIKAYEIRINYFQSRNQMKKSIEAGIEAFREFNVNIPRKVNILRLLFEYLLVVITLPEKHYEKLLELPEMTDPLAIIQVKLIYLLGNSVYMESPLLMALLAFKAVRMTVKYGVSPYAITGLTGFGFLQIGVFNKVQAGVRFGKLALELLHKQKDGAEEVRSLFNYSSFIHFHKYPLRETLSMYDQGYKNAMARGDTEGAAMSLFMQVTHQFFLGDELVSIERSLLKNFPLMKKLKQQWYLRMNTYRLKAVYQLMGMHHDRVLTIEGRTLTNEKDYFKEFHGNKASFAIYYITELLVAYMEERYDHALSCAAKAHALSSSIMASINIPYLYFFWALSLFSQWIKKGSLTQKEIGKWKYCRKVISKMADNTPVNFLFMDKILESCGCWMDKKSEDSIGLFGEAITLVRDYRSLFMKGVVNELFGLFLQTERNDQLYKNFIQDSYYAYQRWGCQPKISCLIERYSFLYDKEMTSSTESFSRKNTMESPSATATPKDSAFFLLSELLKRSGAQRVVLIALVNGNWVVKAEQEQGVSGGILFHDRLLLEDTDPVLPLSMAFYTANSSHSAVVNGKQSSLDFNDDPYLEGRENYSLLTLPIAGGGDMEGFFYLENFQPGFVFSDELIRHLTYFLAGSGYIIDNGIFIHMDTLSKEEKLKTRTASLNTGVLRSTPTSVLYAEMIMGDDNLSHVDSLLNLIEPIIKKYNGTIDHFVGEGLVVYFQGAVSHALDASVSILDSMHKWNNARNNQGLNPVRLGIGINSLDQNSKDTLQRCANTTYRIGAMTSLLGSSILMSGQYYHLLSSYDKYPARKVDLLIPEGSRNPIVIYEAILFPDEERNRKKIETLEDFEKALTYFNQMDFDAAIKLFQDIWHKNPQDRAASMYLTRSRFYRNNGIPPGWDGTESLKSY